jgi:hypothetical protein
MLLGNRQVSMLATFHSCGLLISAVTATASATYKPVASGERPKINRSRTGVSICGLDFDSKLRPNRQATLQAALVGDLILWLLYRSAKQPTRASLSCFLCSPASASQD